jgi:hypothetical protein
MNKDHFKGTWDQAMRRHAAKAIIAMALLLTVIIGLPKIVNAVLITETINFTATDFTSQILAPQDPVSGSFTFTFESSLAPVTGSLTDIALNIAGHAYTLAEVGFTTDSNATSVGIGGLVNGIFQIVSNSGDDFTFVTGLPIPSEGVFLYAVSGTNAIFTATTVTVTTGPVAAPIPEPTTWLLLGSGLAGLIVLRRRYVLITGR